MDTNKNIFIKKRKMKKITILQHERYGLGNFINMTPTIKWLFEETKQKVGVYFSTDYVSECFKDCPFIETLENNIDHFDYVSKLFNFDIEDYKYIFKTITNQDWSSQYHTYIDSANEIGPHNKDYNLVLNGLGGFQLTETPYWMGKKELDEKVFRIIRHYSKTPLIFTGSQKDLERSPWAEKYCDEIYVGDIRKSLSLIRDAKKVISNDTGLAHGAGAMQKDLLILWKDTPFIKNLNPSQKTIYCKKDEWKDCVIEFLNKPILM